VNLHDVLKISKFAIWGKFTRAQSGHQIFSLLSGVFAKPLILYENFAQKNWRNKFLNYINRRVVCEKLCRAAREWKKYWNPLKTHSQDFFYKTFLAIHPVVCCFTFYIDCNCGDRHLLHANSICGNWWWVFIFIRIIRPQNRQNGGIKKGNEIPKLFHFGCCEQKKKLMLWGFQSNKSSENGSVFVLKDLNTFLASIGFSLSSRYTALFLDYILHSHFKRIVHFFFTTKSSFSLENFCLKLNNSDEMELKISESNSNVCIQHV